ncbi:MAG: 6,7-dimethyl-8-ribityllumazine synthase [Candidatus Sulfotelmatobacter sp.]
MLKNVNIGRYLNPADWNILTEFFAGIGFVRSAPDENVLGFQTASFRAPLGTISFTAWNTELPEGLADKARNASFLLAVETSNPTLIYETARRMNLPVHFQDSDIEWSADEPFGVGVPGNILLSVRPRPAGDDGDVSGKLDASGKHFAIVVSRFNAFITERLLASACDGLLRTGAVKKDIAIVRVPGAFEIPSAARTLASTGKYDAIICIGCLLRGDTAHYDVIVNEVTRGIGQSAQETGVPHAFGVLTCDTLEQAIDRAGLKMGNKGFEAAHAAVEMASLKAAVSRQPSAVSKRMTRSSAARKSRKKR